MAYPQALAPYSQHWRTPKNDYSNANASASYYHAGMSLSPRIC